MKRAKPRQNFRQFVRQFYLQEVSPRFVGMLFFPLFWRLHGLLHEVTLTWSEGGLVSFFFGSFALSYGCALQLFLLFSSRSFERACPIGIIIISAASLTGVYLYIFVSSMLVSLKNDRNVLQNETQWLICRLRKVEDHCLSSPTHAIRTNARPALSFHVSRRGVEGSHRGGKLPVQVLNTASLLLILGSFQPLSILSGCYNKAPSVCTQISQNNTTSERPVIKRNDDISNRSKITPAEGVPL